MKIVHLALLASLAVPTWADTLTVDLGDSLGPATHAANGSLYGVIEKIPNDIDTLVAPLNPAVFTAPARAGRGYQQPIGAAIPVAARLAGTGATVMIRLADLCPNWPYTFPGINSYLTQVAAVIQDKKASKLTNFYGYELWNEPNATWNDDNGTFNKSLWLPTFKKVRELDPEAPIVGPSFSEYNHSWMKGFLMFAIDNNCLPEVVCWHELGGGGGVESVAGHLRDYRALEASLGISPRKISINEYCDPDHFLEGQPGSSARFIAKFERYRVDSACISWWFTDLPGRLGSLLTRKVGKPAAESGKGGGWYFYQWYGAMTGSMVRVTPVDEDTDALDGFANLDLAQKTATVCLGGPNKGTVDVNIRNVPADWTSVKVTVESVGWRSKNTAVEGTVTVSSSVQTPANGTLQVALTGLNGASGYRLILSAGE
jgi:hypothetical protein